MKRLLIVMTCVAFVSGVAMAQSVVGTKHDLSTGGAGSTPLESDNIDKVCVFCHTPHQAAGADAQDPLWNHTLSSAGPYGVYASSTLNASPTAFSGDTGSGDNSVSALCMSCHDGTVGVGSLYNDPNDGGTPSNSGQMITGIANLGSTGTALQDDHPVNFTYDSALATEDGGLKTPVSAAFVDAANEVPLFGGSVQCASCHDPHDNDTQSPFLVADNTSSALCIKCHNK